TAVITEAIDSGRTDAIDSRTIDLLTRSLQRLNSMVERALDYAVVEQYASPIAFKIVNLAGLIVQEFAAFEQVRRDRSIRLELPQGPDSIEALVEPALFKKCLQEVISNAHRYTPDGGSIFVSVIPEDLWVSVNFVNTGVEIPAEELRLLFTPFFKGRGANAQSDGGTGLGLSIAWAAARLQGGTLSVESGPKCVRACLKVPSAITRRRSTPVASDFRTPSRLSAKR
ncbi:MAG: HAMP domain-containing sensor histidine kinase, partial [Phycisphaerales bacterium]|nr:HAMP domain-containing sensor histidine kinase [Phycisphaerales bacterium]